MDTETHLRKLSAPRWWVGWSAHMAAAGLAPSTIQARRSTWRHWSSWCEAQQLDLAEVTWRHVEGWLVARNIGACARQRALSDLRQLYRWAGREGLVAGDPTALVVRQRKPVGTPRPVPEWVVPAALADGNEGTVRACALMAYAGLRCGEVARLTWAAVDDSQVWVEGKGGRNRWVPVPAPLRPFLASRGLPSAPVVPRWDGAPGAPHPGTVSAQVSKHLRAVSGLDVSAHQLRHYYAGRVLEGTGSLEVVQMALGHASIATTQVYARLPGGKLREVGDLWG